MTDLQLVFLLLVAGYLVIKATLFILLYWGSRQVETKAQTNKLILHSLLETKRKEDREKHRKSYQRL